MIRFIAFIFLTLGIVLIPGVSYAAEPAPNPVVVLDTTGFFSSSQTASITENFATVAKRYGILPVVEVVKDLGGDSPERYATRRANELGVGDSKANNGLYILMSIKEHALRVQPGVGLARIVSQSTIQSVIDNTMIPKFKSNNFTQGVIDGVHASSEYSLKGTTPPAQSPDSAFDFGLFWKGLGVIAAFGVAIAAAIIFIPRFVSKRRSDKAEQEHDKLVEQLDVFNEKIQNDKAFQVRFAKLPNREARFEELSSQLRFANFDSVVKKESRFIDFENQIASFAIDYAGIEPRLYKNTLSRNESIETFAARVLKEQPEARRAQQAVNDEKIRLMKAEELRNQRAAESRARWATVDETTLNSYSFGNKAERERLGKELFNDYEESNKIALYNSFGDSRKSMLQTEAKQAFSRLPASRKLEISRSSGKRQAELMQQHISGYDPMLMLFYISAASSYSSPYTNSSPGRDSSSSSSNNDSSFSSFDSSSSFGGGSFDGGGGGGSW